MNKTEFVRRVAADNNELVSESERWVNIVFNTLRDSVLDNAKVKISGLGVFEHQSNKERSSVLPDGTPFVIPAMVKLKFHPSKHLGQAVTDGLDSISYAERLKKINAIQRGEYVPGYALDKSGRLIEVDIVDPLAPIVYDD